MSSKRPLILMAVLLALLSALMYQYGPLAQMVQGEQRPKPLPGESRISGLGVTRLPNGHWQVEFDYYYTGVVPGSGTYRIEQSVAKEGAAQVTSSMVVTAWSARAGQNHVKAELPRPPDETVRFTKEVTAMLFEQYPKFIAMQKIPVTIEWPSFESMRLDELLASGTPEQVVAAQALQIDTERREALREAKNVLERLLVKYPQTDAAYIELARIAMKTNWGPEGLGQAEALLESARQLRPDSPNMKILLGYVYTNQKRYREAESTFIEVSQADTPNLWLWTNWGELLEAQGKLGQAVEKYAKAIAQPPKTDTYDNARRWAFERLLAIARNRHDLDTEEALHKQRTADYGLIPCYGPAYAKFLLYQRFDAPAALALGQKFAETRCSANDVNEILGVAHYMMWAAGKDPERAEALRQARVRLPAGPQLFSRLASSDKTVDVARQLVAAGDRIDQYDNNHVTALGYAMQAKDVATAKRLMRLGARPETPVGPADMPVALLPVLMRDFEGIKLMTRAGVDYSKLKYQGSTALDHARETHDRQLLEALDSKSKAL